MGGGLWSITFGLGDQKGADFEYFAEVERARIEPSSISNARAN